MMTERELVFNDNCPDEVYFFNDHGIGFYKQTYEPALFNQLIDKVDEFSAENQFTLMLCPQIECIPYASKMILFPKFANSSSLAVWLLISESFGVHIA